MKSKTPKGASHTGTTTRLVACRDDASLLEESSLLMMTTARGRPANPRKGGLDPRSNGPISKIAYPSEERRAVWRKARSDLSAHPHLINSRIRAWGGLIAPVINHQDWSVHHLLSRCWIPQDLYAPLHLRLPPCSRPLFARSITIGSLSKDQ